MGAGDDRPTAERGERRRVVYCLIPADLAPKLHELLRHHFRDHPDVEVVVERRLRDRRKARERRRGKGAAPPTERRRIRAPSGRRVGERRAALVPVQAPAELPRRARRYAERLTFVERLEPSTQHAEDLDTARLVIRFQAGERETTFTAIYHRYFERVYGYLRTALRDQHEAEDASQQVFAQLFEALPDYERRRQPFRAWLFTIVRNYALYHLRKQRRVDVVDPGEIDMRRAAVAEGQGEVEPDVLNWISDRDLLLFVERLPETQRQVLVLRFVLDLSHAEIAAILNRSTSDVRALQSRALRFMKQRLSALERAPHQARRRHARQYLRQAPVLRGRRFVLRG